LKEVTSGKVAQAFMTTGDFNISRRTAHSHLMLTAD
jgi:hypothetical protein